MTFYHCILEWVFYLLLFALYWFPTRLLPYPKTKIQHLVSLAWKMFAFLWMGIFLAYHLHNLKNDVLSSNMLLYHHIVYFYSSFLNKILHNYRQLKVGKFWHHLLTLSTSKLGTRLTRAPLYGELSFPFEKSKQKLADLLVLCCDFFVLWTHILYKS